MSSQSCALKPETCYGKVCVYVCVSVCRTSLFCIKPSDAVAGKAKSLTYFKDSEGKKKRGNEWKGLTRAVCCSVSVLEG